ncbi:MAG: transglycosylase SLT domain-containing protein [Proteobacteria bacterium]|nr:transglycosylase SLT domain-containing protein [Pseudomonadota bacterium]
MKQAAHGAREIGIGQFMPATWRGVVQQHPELQRQFGITGDPAERINTKAQIWVAAAHLADNLRQYGSYEAALAVYNGGPNGINLAAAQNYAALVFGAKYLHVWSPAGGRGRATVPRHRRSATCGPW